MPQIDEDLSRKTPVEGGESYENISKQIVPRVETEAIKSEK